MSSFYNIKIHRLNNITDVILTGQIEVKNNIVFFPKTSSLGDHSGIDLYMSHVKAYYSYLISNKAISTNKYIR